MTIFLTSQSTTVCMKAATLKGKKRAVHKKAAKERINSLTAWLTDDIIEAAQCLIQENNPGRATTPLPKTDMLVDNGNENLFKLCAMGLITG